MLTMGLVAPIVGALLLVAPAAGQETAAAPQMVQKAAVAVEPAASPFPNTPASAPGAEPEAPGGAHPSLVLPSRESDGRWRTPNEGITADEVAWHVRAALNVAALGCRDVAEAETVAAYNALLARWKEALAEAAAASEDAFRRRHGEAWRPAHDDAMTRLYNFWAQPPVQTAFCREARAVLAEEGTVEPSGFAEWTAASLRRLEGPFTAFFTAVDEHRTRLAAREAAKEIVTVAVTATPATIAIATPAIVQAFASEPAAAATEPSVAPAAQASAAVALPAATEPVAPGSAVVAAAVTTVRPVPAVGAAPEPAAVARRASFPVP